MSHRNSTTTTLGPKRLFHQVVPLLRTNAYCSNKFPIPGPSAYNHCRNVSNTLATVALYSTVGHAQTRVPYNFSVPVASRGFTTSSNLYSASRDKKKKMPPKKAEKQEKVLLGRPGNNLKSGIVRQQTVLRNLGDQRC